MAPHWLTSMIESSNFNEGLEHGFLDYGIRGFARLGTDCSGIRIGQEGQALVRVVHIGRSKPGIRRLACYMSTR